MDHFMIERRAVRGTPTRHRDRTRHPPVPQLRPHRRGCDAFLEQTPQQIFTRGPQPILLRCRVFHLQRHQATDVLKQRAVADRFTVSRRDEHHLAGPRDRDVDPIAGRLTVTLGGERPPPRSNEFTRQLITNLQGPPRRDLQRRQPLAERSTSVQGLPVHVVEALDRGHPLPLGFDRALDDGAGQRHEVQLIARRQHRKALRFSDIEHPLGDLGRGRASRHHQRTDLAVDEFGHPVPLIGFGHRHPTAGGHHQVAGVEPGPRVGKITRVRPRHQPRAAPLAGEVTQAQRRDRDKLIDRNHPTTSSYISTTRALRTVDLAYVAAHLRHPD